LPCCPLEIRHQIVPFDFRTQLGAGNGVRPGVESSNPPHGSPSHRVTFAGARRRGEAATRISCQSAAAVGGVLSCLEEGAGRSGDGCKGRGGSGWGRR
ncbi:hypothetical protein CLOP_g5258, partial [Closterium sp. NIES-67]